MESALSISSTPSFHHQKTPFLNSQSLNLINSIPSYPFSKPYNQPTIKIIAATKPQNNPITQTLKHTARTIIFAATAAATAAAVFSKLQKYPAIAEPIAQTETQTLEESQLPNFLPSDSKPITQTDTHEEPILPNFLESNPEAITAMKTLLEQKLEAGEDEESLKLLKKLTSAQPENVEFKFLMARLLNEMGETEQARVALEEILEKNPLSFEALFENALLMDSCGEGELVIKRLEKALDIAVNENKEKEARDIKLIIAQVQFLQKNVDEALKSYDELLSEDPNDFRPYFCKGMIFSLTDKNDEAKVQFEKYRQLSPKKFDVEGYIRSPLSRMKLFGSDEQN
ncbi:protein SLOW GREEN 1, chloroplastic-like [Rutidosis leptorrhynchoides]|uniref:protein SLOW GREEN 1, chloroplastic-like n=1 Tax=Rutidosis leptorrhynchoides TaxID=125765 RepID=UPI003A993358